MTRVALLILTMLVAAAPAVAQETDSLEACVTITYDGSALSAADVLDEATLAEAIASGAAAIGDPEPCRRPAREAIDPPPGSVSRLSFGAEWPFAFGYGFLACERIDGAPAATLNASDGLAYALTDAAVAAGAVVLDSGSDAWLDDDADATAVLDELTAMAVALCEA